MNSEQANQWLFYIGTYSPKENPGIHLASLNLQSGEMTLLDGTVGVENPSFLALHPDGEKLYAVTETDEGEAVSFQISDDGKLTELSRVQTGGAHPCHIAFSSSGTIITVNYSGGQVSSYTLDDQLAVASVSARIQHEGSGPNPDRQEKAHPHSAIPDPQGKFVYVSDLGTDKIIVYSLEDGRLTPHKEVALPPETGPRHFVVDANERWAYGINELGNTVTVYDYDGPGGFLAPQQHISALPEQANQKECTAADIHISADGRYLYASNRGYDSIVRFAIDAESGRLSDPRWTLSGGKTPRNFALAPGGYLLAANQDSDTIISFIIDPVTGTLKETGHKLQVSKPVCIAGWKESAGK